MDDQTPKVDQQTAMRLLMAERDRLFAYAWSIVRDVHTAEDVFQEVAVLAIERHDQMREPEHLLAWSRNVTRIKSLEALRKRGKQPAVLSEQTLELLDQDWRRQHEQPAGDLMDALHDCIERLPPNARKLVSMRYIEGLTSGRIAEVLQRNTDTVYKALSRAHRALAECVRHPMTGGQHEPT